VICDGNIAYGVWQGRILIRDHSGNKFCTDLGWSRDLLVPPCKTVKAIAPEISPPISPDCTRRFLFPLILVLLFETPMTTAINHPVINLFLPIIAAGFEIQMKNIPMNTVPRLWRSLRKTVITIWKLTQFIQTIALII
jgi:hypothetical protein